MLPRGRVQGGEGRVHLALFVLREQTVRPSFLATAFGTTVRTVVPLVLLHLLGVSFRVAQGGSERGREGGWGVRKDEGFVASTAKRRAGGEKGPCHRRDQADVERGSV